MRRHSLDVVALVCGLVFVDAAVLWFAWDAGLVDARHLGWAAPGLLIAIGVVGVAASLRRRRNPSTRRTS